MDENEKGRAIDEMKARMEKKVLDILESAVGNLSTIKGQIEIMDILLNKVEIFEDHPDTKRNVEKIIKCWKCQQFAYEKVISIVKGEDEG